LKSGPTIDIHASIQFLKGIGPARTRALADTGIKSVSDLLYYFPRRHLNRTSVTELRAIQRDTIVTAIGTVQVCGERKTRKRNFFQATISDGTGLLTLIWFNGAKYISRIVKKDQRLAVNGKIDYFHGHQIIHPEFDILDSDDDPINTGAVIPLYSINQDFKKARIDNRGLRLMIHSVLENLEQIPDLFTDSFLSQQELIPLDQALRNIHYATDEQILSSAVRRLKFDEHFFLQLLMALRKASAKKTGAPIIKASGIRFVKIYEQLDFDLTTAQKKVLKEIRNDLGQGVAMNRLLQGDVGSGKTIVALLTAAIVVGNGLQVAVMAPTEILAQQHYQAFNRYAEAVHLTCALLVGNQKVAERRQVLDALADGRVQIVVGTHALIQESVDFSKLGLVIVDEQHRFGVIQRGDLVAKGLNPHFLAMTATPIPRTLAITYHGDMDLSIIDEMPANRQPIITKVVEAERLDRVYRFIREEVAQGRQCMVVYPLVEETAKSDLAAASEAYDQLTNSEFRDQDVGLLHGRLKPAEKDEIMAAFAANEIKILVATTVIEVGIDVPNATIMLVEHAERFGLTQLHQLRGRVGRGREKSYCILVRRKLTDQADRRLAIMERTGDGFEIADEDLKMRGPGEFYGARQSGYVQYKIANMLSDGPLIRQARQAAFELVTDDPHLRNPQNQAIRKRFMAEYQQMLEIVNIS